MFFDIALLVLTTIMVAFGLWRGLALQLLQLVALICSIILAPVLVSEAAKVLPTFTLFDIPLIHTIGWVAATFILHTTLSLVATTVVSRFHNASITINLLDRLLGATAAIIKSLGIAYIACVGLVLANPLISRSNPSDSWHLRDSYALSVFTDNSILLPWHFPLLKPTHDMLIVAKHVQEPKKATTLRKNYPTTADFLRREPLKKVIADVTLLSFAEKHHWLYLASDPKIRELVNDRKFASEIQALPWEKIAKDLDQVEN